MTRALRPRYLVGAGLLLLAVAVLSLLLIEANAFMEIPYPAQPLAPLVRVPGAKPDRSAGGIFYVAVTVRRASLLEKLFPPVRPSGSTLEPAGDILPPGVSQQEENAAEAREMTNSQKTAQAVAYRALGYHVVARPVGVRVEGINTDSHAVGTLTPTDVIVAADGRKVSTLDDLHAALTHLRPGATVRLRFRRGSKTMTATVATVRDPDPPHGALIGILGSNQMHFELPLEAKFDLGHVGGPSAGLAFALELLEQKGRDVDHGYRVAATGELLPDGTVVRIGGVKQKTIGARDAHVDVFLVPQDGGNAAVAKRYAHGLRIIPVKSFQQALRALATLPRKR